MVEGDLSFEKNQFIAIFDFKKIPLDRQDKIMDLYFFDKNFNKYLIRSSGLLESLNLNLKNKFLKVDLCNKDNKIYLKYDTKIKAHVNKIELGQGNLEIFFGLNNEIDETEVRVSLKQRLTRDIFTYRNLENYKVVKKDCLYYTNISFNNKFSYYENEAYDFFVEILMPTSEILCIPLSTDSTFNEVTRINNFYNGLVYTNYKKQLAILAKRDSIPVSASKIVIEDKILKLDMVNDIDINQNVRINSITIEPKMEYNSNTQVPYSYALKKSSSEFQPSYYLDLEDFISNKNIYDNLCLGLFVELVDTNNLIICKQPLMLSQGLKIDKKNYQINNMFNLKIDIKNKDICLLVRKKIIGVDYDPIRIAVLGFCMSRLAFSSSDYFNPQYKSKYKIVYTSFHTSLISLFSKPIENTDHLCNTYFKYLKSATLQNYIKDDMEKNFFENIKNTKPNFLIIDFYQDAVRDIIIFNDEKVLSAGINMRDSEYLDSIKSNAKIITHNDVNLYIEKWEEAIRKFANEIVKYINPNRIIINCQNSVNEYIDNNGNKVKYKTLDQFVKRNNYFFEYMSKSLLNIIPEAHVIDLSALKYVADSHHPEGNTPTHYQKEYYSEFIKCLDDIVLKTFLTENKIDLE